MKTSIKTGRIIVFLMIPTLIIDSLTGWLAFNGSSFSPAQVYRSALLIAILTWTATFWINGFLILCSSLILTLFSIILHTKNTESTFLTADIRFNLSLLAGLFFYVFFRGYIRLIKSNPIEVTTLKKNIDRILLVSAITVTANIIFGIFGIGYSTLASYGTETDALTSGAKGFFIAGNDLSSVFLIISGLLLMQTWLTGRTNAYYVQSTATLILAVLLLTKSVIIGTILLVIGIPLSASKIASRLGIHYKPIIPSVFGITLAAITIIWLINTDSAIVRRFIYLYENSDLLTSVTTGRVNFAQAAIEILNTKFTTIDWLFGLGWEGFLAAMTSALGFQKNTEIDYIDILLINGISGITVTTLIWLWLLISAFKQLNNTRTTGAVLFMDLLLLTLAGTAGHVLYSAMNGVFIAILNIVPLIAVNNDSQSN